MEDKEIMIEIRAMAETSEDGLLSPFCCIYRVPPMIRLLKEEAYTPKVVSVGPFHYGDVRLQDMERHKRIMFKRFAGSAKTDLDTLVNFVKQSEPKVRASYSESIKHSKKDLVKLILVDAAFIIELFRMFYRGGYEVNKDAKLSHSWLRDAIVDDLLLLENQLPFFVIEELFDVAFPLDLRGDIPSFLELTYSYFIYYNIQSLDPSPDISIKHFTDLLRFFYLPRGTIPRRKSFKGDGSDILLYSANELQEAGVKLKASTSKCLLDLKFSGSVFEIPQIYIEDITETLFRNMIALERCHYPYESYIIDYAFVLDGLINNDKDVDALIREKIIHNWLGDTNEVATLFNGLGRNINQWNFSVEYLDICIRLNSFYQDPWHKKKATLKRDYFKTPWQTVASIAGIILLILTFIQTIFSILQVVL
ncbi:UPF0481 protein At3g47200-like [Prosopis cineraria]|uniref:UPF0481 protein At3g47200-like n=1 Tax=Prosopis cineraria TaxID=364024 RepID=UPI00240F9F53|nr:UPF0481 protein At3g47200-like [Prosopis cineraria]